MIFNKINKNKITYLDLRRRNSSFSKLKYQGKKPMPVGYMLYVDINVKDRTINKRNKDKVYKGISALTRDATPSNMFCFPCQWWS